MSDRLSALRLFARVARKGSFSAAARELGLTQPTASKIIAALEREVGASLLVRTTRAVTLTEVGISYLARIEQAIAELDEADHEARGGGELRGVLRVALTSSIAVREIIPRLPAFASRHPALRIVLLVDDERQNLLEEGIDVSLRLGPLESSSMIARHVGEWPFVVVAAPAYLNAAGHPATPSDLRALSTISHSESPTNLWTFRKGNAVEAIELIPKYVINSNEGCIAAAKAGLGFTYSATLAVRRELEEGCLIRILPEWHIGSLQLNVLFPAGKAVKPAAREFGAFVLGLHL
ncbi:LysR family transcriptional regulator [Methylocapsa sp. S129]|uniref:LysR family transcriptional regulator n=1 Tax=Methylocapsa sp. S129 TaxID=1641869 RepID=UPI00131B0DB8|nr:LysR family transcriptional regulator [Methylocapsa sp. S129]